MSTSEFRFRPADRLRKANGFDAVFQQGTRASDRYFTFIALPNTLGHARLGIAISKKALRRAVDRNRMRRIIRESFRCSPARTVALDIVVMARQGTAEAPSPALTNALNARWSTVLTFYQRLSAESKGATP